MPPKKWENSFSFPQEKKMHVAPNDDDAAGKIEFKDVCREKMTLQGRDNVGVSRLLFNPDQLWSCRARADHKILTWVNSSRESECFSFP